MAGRGWTRQWALALFVLSGALLTGGEDKDAKPEKEPARQFNSKLPFRVWVQVEEGQDSKDIGETPSEQPLAIPSCRRWWVQPLGRPDLAAVAKEVEAQRIQGLQLSDSASDDDLVHLKELKGLRELNLWQSQVTDAGLAHLKELKGLQTLSLSWTPVTDAGLVYLKELKGLRELYLYATPVTDAGLAHLKELTGLQFLGLRLTNVTDAGISELKKSLPNVRVSR